MRNGPRWYALRTKRGLTFTTAWIVEEALKLRCFAPCASYPLPNGAREIRPLFGPLAFVRFDRQRDDWGALLRLRTVPNDPLLHMADPLRPSPISDRLIARIHRDTGRCVEDIERRRYVVANPVATVVSAGAEVRLCSNLLRGAVGAVTETRQGGRLAKVAIDGAELPMWVPADQLELLTGAVAA